MLREYCESKTFGSVQLMRYWKISLPGRSVIENRWPPPRNARPLKSSPNDSGKSEMSKFRCTIANSPKNTESEPAATPKFTEPVFASLTSTRTSR